MKWGNVFHYYLCYYINYCILYNEKADEKLKKKKTEPNCGNTSPTDVQSEQENNIPLHAEYTNYQNEDSVPEVDIADVEDSDTNDHELGTGLGGLNAKLT